MYKRFVHALPKKYVKRMKDNLLKAGVNLDVNQWTGFFFLYTLALSLTITFIVYVLNTNTPAFLLVLTPIIIFVSIHLLSEIIFLIAIDRKNDFVEKILPDVLTIMSSNIRSGISAEKAIFLSAREEFGSFSKNIKNSSKKALFGYSTEDALTELSRNSSSPLVRRAVKLIVEGVKGGSKMSALIEGIAEDVRQTKQLKDKMKASIGAYSILFMIASSFGAPLLFALSGFLVESMTTFQDVTSVPGMGMGSLTIRSPGQSISAEHIQIISLASLLLNAVFTSLIIGELESEKAIRGVKYMIPLSALAITVFFIVKKLAQTMFTQIAV
ncbi:MAG: hypothetical protein GOU97_04390 [Nanoarchaeota archaeon]|nr:hypothetical protein [Nanoarchaeota archaeon]